MDLCGELCARCGANHRGSNCPPPRSYGTAHFRGMTACAGLRLALAGNVRALLSVSKGQPQEVAADLGMPIWKVRQLAAGDVDPTLGEIGRIAALYGATLEEFLSVLIDEAEGATRATLQPHAGSRYG